MHPVPPIRITTLHDAAERAEGEYVLYWMIAARRLSENFGLQRAVERAEALGLPLVILEALRVAYPWASERLHRFVIDGMADHARRAAGAGQRALYLPYVEPEPGAGSGLLWALAERAALVVTDEFPCFFLPSMLARAAQGLAERARRLEVVDSNGLLPLRAAPKMYTTAYSFRRGLHKILPRYLEPDQFPALDPLSSLSAPPLDPGRLAAIRRRWPAPGEALLSKGARAPLARLPIDHAIAPVDFDGGPEAGSARLKRFISERLERFGEDRNKPGIGGGSGLSPYLHFGHLAAHAAFRAVAARDGWSAERLAPKPTGKREGWWNMSHEGESFLDELITWREIGLNRCHFDPHGYMDYETLPEWARTTLEVHESDRREHLYSLEEFEGALTHDELWNAAQNELRRTGSVHNYMRMLWGKKILEWSPTPRRALEVMIELNDKYAVDGRDPNSYSGIFWCLGRFDRAWGERPIFGKVRYMSSASTRKKFRLKGYLERYAAPA